MKLLLASLACLSFLNSFSQNHAENVRSIETVEEANTYAAGFREVSVSLMNAEKDVIFFDDIDTSDLAKHVGESRAFYGRTTKLIDDSIISLINVQIISFDLTKISKETAELMLSQMFKKLEAGESYWSLKKKYAHTSAQFTSSPEALASVTSKYNLTESELTEGSKLNWEIVGSKSQVGIIIVSKAAHSVPAFYTLSYLNLN
jgi:hypothetical protein